MKRRALLLALPLALPLCWAPSAAFAQPTELPGMRPQGQAQMRFLGLLIYDIKLWVKEGAKVDAQNWAAQDLALELIYARSLSGKEIAKRSLVEMRRQGEIPQAKANAWLAEMEAAFPDVKAGDRISGLQQPGRGAQFFVNGRPGRSIADADFARFFFGIWLAPQSSEPALRSRLLDGDANR